MAQHTMHPVGQASGATMGLDVGDRYSYCCVLDAAGDLMEEGRVATTPAALERRFAGGVPMRVVLETGPHSPWITRRGSVASLRAAATR